MQTETIKLRELTVRYAVRRDGEGRPIVIGRELSSPKDAASAFMLTLHDEPAEVFAILCLTTKHRVIAYHEVSRGTLDSSLVHQATAVVLNASVTHARIPSTRIRASSRNLSCSTTPAAPRLEG